MTVSSSISAASRSLSGPSELEEFASLKANAWLMHRFVLALILALCLSACGPKPVDAPAVPIQGPGATTVETNEAGERVVKMTFNEEEYRLWRGQLGDDGIEKEGWKCTQVRGGGWMAERVLPESEPSPPSSQAERSR